MNDLHIDDFCKDTAKTFLLLYRNFPKKITLYVEDICGPDTPDEFGLHAPRFQAAFSAVIWLAEQGLLRYSAPIQQEAFEEVSLTQKSFVLLTAMQPLLAEKADATRENQTQSINIDTRSRIQQIQHSLKKESSDSLKNRMINFFNLC